LKKYVGLIATILAGAALLFTLTVKAESTVVTSQGTFRCATACVVDSNGGVTDLNGGHVWKLQEDHRQEP